MGKVFDGIDTSLAAWIDAQPMWFVATAPLAGDGHVNLSPRGHDSLSVLGPYRLAWVDYTGSGVETIAHLRENGRVTLMWCSYAARPRIVRVHGRGSVAMPGSALFEQVVARHPEHPSTRAVVVVDVERVSDSCGYSVPLLSYEGDRDLLLKWSDRKTDADLADYRRKKNGVSIDGLPALSE